MGLKLRLRLGLRLRLVGHGAVSTEVIYPRRRGCLCLVVHFKQIKFKKEGGTGDGDRVETRWSVDRLRQATCFISSIR